MKNERSGGEMKSKPAVMGDSGTGKTAAFSFIRECMAVNQVYFIR